jgi:methionine--tRNA ligase beta chain
MEKIKIEDFLKIEMKVGKILSAENIEGSEKLLKLSVSFGEESPRQVLSGIKKYFPEPAVLVGKKCGFVTNLEPRQMMGLESQAMIMAASSDEKIALFEVSEEIPEGTKIK